MNMRVIPQTKCNHSQLQFGLSMNTADTGCLMLLGHVCISSWHLNVSSQLFFDVLHRANDAMARFASTFSDSGD